MSDKRSGKLSFTDGVIEYQVDDYGWSVKLSDVHLIAEYTTANGPHIDDYFFVFLTAKENGWHEASFYAEGKNTAFDAIEKVLGAPIEIGLCNSTEYRTRILWPPALKGKPLMQIVPNPTKLGRILSKISGREDIELTDEAKSVLPD